MSRSEFSREEARSVCARERESSVDGWSDVTTGCAPGVGVTSVRLDPTCEMTPSGFKHSRRRAIVVAEHRGRGAKGVGTSRPTRGPGGPSRVFPTESGAWSLLGSVHLLGYPVTTTRGCARRSETGRSSELCAYEQSDEPVAVGVVLTSPRVEHMRANWTWSVSPYLRSALATLALVALPAAARAQAGTTITGRVTASGTNEPLGEGRVMLVGTSIAATTNSDGKYTLRGVPSGTVEVRVIRVGYTEQKKAVTVTAGGATTLDFAMEPAIVKLQEIVTTATGEQRRVELGNSVTTLGDVTTKVETAPISTLGDLLVAKAAGVTVLPGSMTGTAPVVRIRGVGSLATSGSGISNNPIYVIDGVRMNSQNINLFTGGVQASALNDIDPNEIEDIEIVKGPSAATLYGTDAANGVIVITTKKGHAGDTRWTWYGEGSTIDDRTKYPADFASWGHVTAAAATPDLPEGSLQRCTLVTEGQGLCALDSLTSFNVLKNSSSTSLRLGNGNNFGMNASGGNDAVRFFLSGDVRNESGPVQMPGFAKATLDTMG